MTARPIVCFGEMLLRLSTSAGRQIADVQSLDLAVGGAEANVGVALSALGWPVRMATALPDNPLGGRALSMLAANGLDTSGIVRGPGRMGLYFMETGASLRPSTITYDRAGSTFATFAAEQFNFAALLDGARLLHLTGITPALGPEGLALAQAAVAASRKAGVPISFDANYRESLWQAWDSDPRKALHALIADADILFAGHRDMAMLLGLRFSENPVTRRHEAAAAAFASFPALQVVASTARHPLSQTHHRLSARVDLRVGAVVSHHQTAEIDVTDIADRIGSGDAFAAGVLHGWLSGDDARLIAESGLALGALKHGLHGDFCRIGRAELQAFTGVVADVQR